jgi:hypothetical protein
MFRFVVINVLRILMATPTLAAGNVIVLAPGGSTEVAANTPTVVSCSIGAQAQPQAPRPMIMCTCTRDWYTAGTAKKHYNFKLEMRTVDPSSSSGMSPSTWLGTFDDNVEDCLRALRANSACSQSLSYAPNEKTLGEALAILDGSGRNGQNPTNASEDGVKKSENPVPQQRSTPNRGSSPQQLAI